MSLLEVSSPRLRRAQDIGVCLRRVEDTVDSRKLRFLESTGFLRRAQDMVTHVATRRGHGDTCCDA